MSPAQAERRQLTVLFCDLVGSTRMSEQLDPEDMSRVMRTYLLACDEVVRSLEGHVAQHLGDGVLVYFGYPFAQEDAARRAVRAGLQILERLPQLAPHIEALNEPLRVRIGIHTGVVVVGGPGYTDRLAVGGALNVAAHIQSVAPAGSVVVSGVTHRLVRDDFSFRALGPQRLKNIASPMPVFEVTGEIQERVRRRDLGALVGRARELALLGERWDEVKRGQGRVVMVSGEPGIGKSRLIGALEERIQQDPHLEIESRCSAYHQNSTLYPLIESIEGLLRFQRDDSAAQRLLKLTRAVSGAEFATPESVSLLASLLSLPLPEEAPPLALGAQARKERTLEVLMAWLLAITARQPVHMVMEDLHWADPSTLELLDLLIERSGAAPLLLVVTSRNGKQLSRWETYPHVSHVGLGRLAAEEIHELVTGISEGKPLPPSVVAEIAAKTDGVPLFAEEFTKMVLESGCVRRTASGWEATASLPTIAIPTTLQDSLMARLDQIPAAKRVAQLAAPLGRSFPYELIRSICDLDEATLDAGLESLVRAELLRLEGSDSNTHYVFKHALIRDAAYESVLKSARQGSHRRIAQVLEQRFAPLCETQPEIVAHHFSAAGDADLAIPYWKRAGQRALTRSAYVEALNHFTRALDLLEDLPASDERRQLEIELCSSRGVTLVATRGYGAAEVERDYSRAAHLSRHLGRSPRLFPALYGLWTYHLLRDERGPTQDLAERLRGIAGSPQHEYAATAAAGVTAYWGGDFVHASRLLRGATELYRPEYRALLADLGDEAPVLGRIYLIWCLIEQGLFAQARVALDAVPDLVRDFSHPYIETTGLVFEMCARMQYGEVERVRELGQRITQLASEQQFLFYLAPARCGLGWVDIQQGACEEGIRGIREGIAIFQGTGAVLPCSFWLGHIAAACLLAGRIAEGLAAVSEALASEKRLARFRLAELYRLQGELRLRESGDADAAEHSFRTALQIAAEQGSRTQELHAATSLARLLGQRRPGAEGRELLQPLWDAFPEGLETPVYRQAGDLLRAF